MLGYDLVCFSKCCWLDAPGIKFVSGILLYCIVFEVVDEVDESGLDAPASTQYGTCMFSPCRLVNDLAQIGHARSIGGGGGGSVVVVLLRFFDGWDKGIPEQVPMFAR